MVWYDMVWHVAGWGMRRTLHSFVRSLVRSFVRSPAPPRPNQANQVRSSQPYRKLEIDILPFYLLLTLRMLPVVLVHGLYSPCTRIGHTLYIGRQEEQAEPARATPRYAYLCLCRRYVTLHICHVCMYVCMYLPAPLSPQLKRA